jgi:Bacterial Ig-like domain (group 3)/Autotransporter beta-domain
VGLHAITATYSGGTFGDGTRFGESSGHAFLEVVRGGTSHTIVSSHNQSVRGQPVTFTATVIPNAPSVVTPTGSVTFTDGATTIATIPLNSSGQATLTTTLPAGGTHTITATYTDSDGNYDPSTATLTHTVVDQLRALQVAVSKAQAQASGSAFEGAVAGAIAEGFAEGGGALITPSGGGVRFNFAAEPDASLSGGRLGGQYDSVTAARANALRDSGLSAMNQNLPVSVRSFAPDASLASARADDAFNALAYAKPMVTKAPPLVPPQPKVWLLWADVRGTGWNTDPSAGDIRGGQINAIAGLTRKLTPDFLIGVLGGYENFDYTSQTLNGRLKGDGWTVGGYLGWRIWPGARFDAAVGRSGISYDGVSGTAAASFPGNRWLASAALTGTYRTPWLEIEPSAKVYAIWERDSSYIDSLSTPQPENTFSSGRASTGVKVAYPMYWDAVATFAPYVGVYADYYFSSDNAALLLPTQFVQGWAARTTAGVTYTAADGARILVGGEIGGLGSQNFTTWSVRGRASVPF